MTEHNRYKSACAAHKGWVGQLKDAPACILAQAFNQPGYDACVGNYDQNDPYWQPGSQLKGPSPKPKKTWPERIKAASGSLLGEILGFGGDKQ